MVRIFVIKIYGTFPEIIYIYIYILFDNYNELSINCKFEIY